MVLIFWEKCNFVNVNLNKRVDQLCCTEKYLLK